MDAGGVAGRHRGFGDARGALLEKVKKAYQGKQALMHHLCQL